MTRVIVTGASGFIGRHLIPHLQQADYQVITLSSNDGDIADGSTWGGLKPADVVVHLAGKTFVPDSWVNPSEFIKCNLLGTVQALDYCKKHEARLIYLSSYLYGNPLKLPISENDSLVANNPYALSKKLAEEACQFYSEAFGIGITALRPFNVYGPGQSDHFLIPWIIRQVRESSVINVKDLEPKRDYIYINDLISAILKAVTVVIPAQFEAINIGTGVSHSVEELIKIVQTVSRTNLPIHSGGERRKDEVMDTVASISKAQHLLGWAPNVSLLQGIKLLLNQPTVEDTQRDNSFSTADHS